MIECAAKIWTTRGMFSWYKKGGFRTAKSRKHKGKKGYTWLLKIRTTHGL